MARASVLGNGNTLVCLDNFGQIRDFYFPYVGQENHIGQGQLHKIGIFVDGGMHWLDNGEWRASTEYANKSMIAKTNAVNEACKLSVDMSTVVYNEKNIFLRKLVIKNNGSKAREIKVFFDQQFKIGETNHADTAYFSDSIESIIHYKGRRVFLVGGLCDNKAFDQHSIGFCGIEGKEGTWRDAEDGKLSENQIEHGIVDSVISWSRVVPPGGNMTVYHWIAAGETYREVVGLLNYLFEKTPEHVIESTQDFWNAWIGQLDISLSGLSPRAKDLFYASLLVMRAHSDNRGGILASSDSGNVQYGGDTYVYVWPRDACFTAWVFDQVGFYDISRRFYDFANNVITEDGYVLHKYQPDRSLGSSWHPWVRDGKRQLAIQEDETAIFLVGLWEHYVRAKDLEFIENLYNSLIKRAATFLIKYKDSKTGLPLPSYDIWEERYGVSSFTASLVYGALNVAGNFAKILGKEDETKHFYSEAQSMRSAILKELWNEDKKCFIQLVEKDGQLEKDTRVDMSNFYGPFKFGVLAPDDPRLKNFFSIIKQKLSSGIHIGGIARYENDGYLKSSDSAVGNPWFVTSLWATQYKIASASSSDDLKDVLQDIEWAASKAFYHMFSEQLNPNDSSSLSATPLVWSHAEYVRTIVEYEKKMSILVKT